MKSILVLITSSINSHANAASAYAYVTAALDAGYQVSVFFYGNGVLDCNSFNSPLSDELNLTNKYKALAANPNLQLLACNTAANRRGVLPAEDQNNNGFNLCHPFLAAGLTEFASLSQKAEQMVQF